MGCVGWIIAITIAIVIANFIYSQTDSIILTIIILSSPFIVMGLADDMKKRKAEENQREMNRKAEEEKLGKELAAEEERKKKEELDQKQRYASEVQDRLKYARNHGGKRALIIKDSNLRPKPESFELQKKFWGELDEMSTLLQKLDNIAKELKVKEDGNI